MRIASSICLEIFGNSFGILLDFFLGFCQQFVLRNLSVILSNFLEEEIILTNIFEFLNSLESFFFIFLPFAFGNVFANLPFLRQFLWNSHNNSSEANFLLIFWEFLHQSLSELFQQFLWGFLGNLFSKLLARRNLQIFILWNYFCYTYEFFRQFLRECPR